MLILSTPCCLHKRRRIAYRRYARRKQLRRIIAAVMVVQHAVLRRQALRRINQLRHERNRREAEARAPSRSPDGVRPGSTTLPRPPSTHFVDQAGHEVEVWHACA